MAERFKKAKAYTEKYKHLLQPCKECGSTDVRIMSDRTMGVSRDTFFVSCQTPHCDCTDSYTSVLKAIEKWNRQKENRISVLHLDGIKAYIKRYGVVPSIRVNKADFESLINEGDIIIDVIVNRNTAEKYAKRMNRLGYILKNKAEYDMFTFRLTYHKI